MANLGVNVGALAGGLGSPISYPFVNGFRPSWASIEFKPDLTNGQSGQNPTSTPLVAMQSIDYKITRERKKTQGTNVKPLAKTRGTVDFTCKIKILLAEFNLLIAQLGQLDQTGNNAYGDIFFLLNVTYSETNMALVSDQIQGCTIDSVEQSSAVGSDDIVVECELNPLDILRNGQSISSQTLSAANF